MSVVAETDILQDRSTYLPQEARRLRKRIADLDEQSVKLYQDAFKEQRLLARTCGAQDGAPILLEVEMFTNDIAGYASYATLRVPVRYPADALERLRRLAVFDLGPVAIWYSQCGAAAPKTRLYLESMDHLRLLTMDYIRRFDELTTDQKSF